ncbi:RNA-guided endonuclease TnpB family protein [Dorea sp.]
MNIAYRFRIYPTEKQKILLAKTFGCCRFLYNQMLNDKIQEYEKTKKMLKDTPAMYKKEYPFLKEVDSLALSNVQLHLEKAYQNFFRDPKIGFPKFKSKHRTRKSYTTNVVNGNIRLEECRIRLPKLEWLHIKKHREIPCEYRLKSVTVSMEPSGKYFASLLYERSVSENQTTEKDYRIAKILGIDYAMKGMAVFSDDIVEQNIGYFRRSEQRLAREQRKLSRCVKGSHNYQQQKRKVAICHEKIRNQRKDFQHKLSRRIADQYDVVAVEDIDMKAMSQCLNFGKSVSDNGYGKFREMLEYKLGWQGKELVKVDRFFPSSKKCCKCGKVKKELKLSERIYRCECGNEIDRDRNAAINICEEARRMLTA